MSKIKAAEISDSAGTGPITLTGQYGAKVWATVQQGSTFTLHDSFNTASIVDSGTGATVYNFTNDMSDEYYSMSASSTNSNNFTGIHHASESMGLPTASKCNAHTKNHDGSSEDATRQYIIVVGDLA
jgi:hypothetical protein